MFNIRLIDTHIEVNHSSGVVDWVAGGAMAFFSSSSKKRSINTTSNQQWVEK
jgi:hypothetical protein